MARTLSEIMKDYEGLYFKIENNPRLSPKEYVRQRMPKYLQTEANNAYFEFVEKIMKFEQQIEFWIWILESQFSVLTAKGKFLDNLGRWLGIYRPPLPVKRTNEPVVIYPPKQGKTTMTDEELLEFNTLHGFTDINGQGVKNTFFPSRDFIGEVSVNDEEYRLYIISILRIKMGITLETIIDIFAKILVKPFFITRHDDIMLEITASFYEDAIRLVIIREITTKLRTTGFDIRVVQAISEKPPEISLKYGDDCWEQQNPYLSDSNEALV